MIIALCTIRFLAILLLLKKPLGTLVRASSPDTVVQGIIDC